jgi:hypothetical protein
MSKITADQKSSVRDILNSGIAPGPDGVTVVEEGLYDRAVPLLGQTEEVMRDAKEVNEVFVSLTADVFGNKVLDQMEKHADLQQVTATIPMIGRDHVELSMLRSKEVRNVGTGETSTKYGVLDIGVKQAVGNKQAGELKKIRAGLSEDALKRLTE